MTPSERIIKEYLDKPKLKQVSLMDHGPFDPTTDICLTCGRSALSLHNEVNMPRCEP